MLIAFARENLKIVVKGWLDPLIFSDLASIDTNQIAETLIELTFENHMDRLEVKSNDAATNEWAIGAFVLSAGVIQGDTELKDLSMFGLGLCLVNFASNPHGYFHDTISPLTKTDQSLLDHAKVIYNGYLPDFSSKRADLVEHIKPAKGSIKLVTKTEIENDPLFKSALTVEVSQEGWEDFWRDSEDT